MGGDTIRPFSPPTAIPNELRQARFASAICANEDHGGTWLDWKLKLARWGLAIEILNVIVHSLIRRFSLVTSSLSWFGNWHGSITGQSRCRRSSSFFVDKLGHGDLEPQLGRDLEFLGCLGRRLVFVIRFDGAVALALIADQRHFPAGHHSSRFSSSGTRAMLIATRRASSGVSTVVWIASTRVRRSRHGSYSLTGRAIRG